MTRSRPSHPPALVRLARRELESHELVRAGELILAAVSGGPDSMATMHVLALLRRSLGFRLAACGVDHGLRTEAGAEIDLARQLAHELGVPFEARRIKVRKGANLMARARDARFEALREVAGAMGASSIALGHHADDRAETVLIRILQGAGPAGLAVLPSRAGDLIRPLVRARRSQIIGHLERHRIAFACDPSNRDARFLRTIVRTELVPLLERLCPRVVEHLCHLADDLAALVPQVTGPTFKRAHLEAFAKAAAGKRTVRVALPAGKVAVFDPKTREIVIEAVPDERRRPRGRNLAP